MNSILLNNNLWPAFAKAVAAPSDPLEYSPAAVDRLLEYLNPYIIRVSGMRPQFKARNACMKIDFETREDRQAYDSSWERFQKNVAKIEEANLSNGGMLIMVEQLIQRMSASLLKAGPLAKMAYNNVTNNNKASVIGVCFKPTVAKIVKILTQDYGVKRDDISIIWGGSNDFHNSQAKEDIEVEEIQHIIQEMREGKFIDKKRINSIKKKLTYAAEGLSDLPSELRLGAQSRKQRQEEIDKFQSGKSRYCIFTFKSGGVGLSLHHCDDLSPFKVRRKDDSNWAIVEDIPKVPVLPRASFLEPTYSGIEMVQGLGRVPRLTSLSDSEQLMLFFSNTIEERVMAIVSKKLRCLKQVVRSNEHWEDIIITAARDSSASYTDTSLDKYIEVDSSEMHELQVDDEEEEESDSSEQE